MFLAKTCISRERLISTLVRTLLWKRLFVRNSHLSELDTHLVVRVDSPNGTLDVDLVLCQCNDTSISGLETWQATCKATPTVKSDQATQSLGGELLEHDRVGRLVAGKDLALDESIVLGLFRSKLLDDLFLGLSEGEGSV
jgi:hypothetical protein